MATRYPIYVISKGRANSCLTTRALDWLGVDHKVVIEPTEYEDYSNNVDPKKLLQLPFSDLGQGSIPARNWVWDHSKSLGYGRHWILDDNLEDFNRLNRNMKLRVRTDAMFRAAEDFVDRYENVPLSGFNYYSFAKSTDKVPPYYINTRVYSCILIDNNLEHRWRGKFNEDTDLSLRVLKSGYCTILFNAFLCGKITTMRMSGGNTDSLYHQTDNRKEFVESLIKQHPDVVKMTKKFGRWHHQVNYKPFKGNELKLKGEQSPDIVNEYGMYIKEVRPPKTR